MSFTYYPATETGRVRLLIPDRVENGHLFEDEEIAVFLDMEGNNVKRAAALALETAASDNALVLKVIRVLDLTTDGQKTAQALMERAATLRSQAQAEEDAEDGGAFDIAEWSVNDFAAREILRNAEARE